MILLLLINQLLACEFEFIYNEGMEEMSYDVPQADFTAFGIWTRYYAFYLDISIQKVKYQHYGRQFDAYQIITGSYNDGTYLDYFIIKENGQLSYFLTLNSQQDKEYLEFKLFQGESDDGVWMFTYIGLDYNNNEFNIILVNTKTLQFERQQYLRQIKQIESIKLFGKGFNTYPFSGQISFALSQSQFVKFYYGEQLVTYLQSCKIDNSCTLNKKNVIIQGIINSYNSYSSYPYLIIQDNYWIDGWFIFTPSSQMQKYNNLIVQLIQQGKELLNYSGIIPLKISLNFDQNNLSNNGITVETSSYTNAIWDDSNVNPIKVKIFNESYLKLLQNWVYFRFLESDQIDRTAEFYLSFSDSSYVNKNMGQINLFKYGNISISLGQSQLNPYSFLGQLANINIQSCIQNYPQAKKACHFTCLACFGPMENNCLSCIDQIQSNRILNPITNTCNCKASSISVEGYVQCMEIQQFMKSATFSEFQQSESLQCKDGQFQYKDQDLIKCYDCPQQSTLGLQCGNCLENPSGWQKNMICSYDYYQYNHNENNTFIKYLRPSGKIDYYYIQDNQLLICSGCNLNEGSYQIMNDQIILYGSCQQNYYYNDSSCYPCKQNCKECEDLTGKCYKCETGNVLYNEMCQSCPDNCLTCQYTDQIICVQCSEGFTPGNGICYQCDTNCLICEFDAQLNRPKCTVCKSSGYFLPFEGTDCVENTILHCLIQYQQQIQYLGEIDENHPQTGNQSSLDLAIRYNIRTTLGFEKIQPPFRPIIRQIITNNCALCAPQYMNGDTFCIFNDTLKSDEQVLIKQNYGQCCINVQESVSDDILNSIDICKDEYFEQDGIECKRKILGRELIYLISSQSSHQEVSTNCEIDECKQCLNVQTKDRCISCSQGQYPEILSGLCFSCPQSLNCKTCRQQNLNDKDGWKWNVRAYAIYLFQSDLLSSIKKDDYEVICLTCLEGYTLFETRCILKCPINCKECTIINGQNVCTFCGSNDLGKYLTLQNNQCQNCPQNCEFCQPRLQEEVYKINNFFNPDDASIYYYSYICLMPRLDTGIYYNQFFQQYIKCQNGKFCMGQLNLKINAYCDLESYDKEKSKYENEQEFYYQNIYIGNNSQLFLNIETPQLIEYLNGIQIQSFIYEISLISSSNFCSIYSNLISTNLPKNVFSLVYSKLIINANNLTLISQRAEIQNFTEVQFQQCIFHSYFKLTIYHPNEMSVMLKDNYFISEEYNYMEILLINPIQIEITNFYIQTIQNLLNLEDGQMISYKYTNSSTSKYLNIQIDNLKLIKSQFYYHFLILANIMDINLTVSNSIIESTFYSSSFIKQYEQDKQGQIYLNNVTFIIQAYDSSIIQLDGYFDVYCSVKLTGKLIGDKDRSSFIRTTKQFNIINSEIFDLTLSASTVFANNMPYFYNYLNFHQIENLIFNKVLADNQSILITIYNSYGQDILEIQNIQVIDCQLTPKYQKKNDIAFIIFEGGQFALKNSYFNKSILGLIDISVIYCYSVVIDNVTVSGNNIQGLQNKLDCLQSLVDISQKNAFINLENIEFIEIKNSQFNNIMIQNFPIIGIFFTDDNMKYQIQVTNTSFKNNLILITELKRQASILQLTSTKPGNFSAINLSFTENIVIEYLQNKFQNSATTFLIEAAQFNIILKDILLKKNQIFNSSNSILYIQAKTVIVQNSIFTQSNLYDDFILKFVIWGSLQINDFYQENLQEIFPILSLGGNAKFVVDDLLIQFCQFSHSIAKQGSGFYLTVQNLLQISDSTFQGLQNKMDNDDSQGGSIYISLVASNTSIEIKETSFEDSTSLYDGGAIYISSRYTTSNISLSQIRVKNCYSFKGAFISVYSNKYSTIKFTNISVRNIIEGFKDFLTQFQDLNDNFVKQFHLNSAKFYIQYGSLYISNSIISDIQLSSVIYFYSASNLYIQAMVIQNIQFSSQGLIQIFPTTNMNITTLIQNVQILHCNTVQPQQIICQIDIISYINKFQCQNYNDKPNSLSQQPYDQQAKFKCYQSKLLDFTTSFNMIYVDRIQISDYLYISDLNMRNNNCSFCRDGMITIKNVDINIPEFNNIIFKQLQFQNNSCGSGCLVISQQDYINFPTRRILQTLYQTRFNIPFTVTLEQSEFVNNSASNGIVIVSNLSLAVIDNKFIKNTGFDISSGILFLGGLNHNFQIMASEISDSLGNKGGALYLGNKTISNIELLQILLSSNKAKSFGQDLVDTPQALTISLDRGKTLLNTKYLKKTPLIIEEIVTKPYLILGNNTLQQFITLPSGYNIKNYEYYDEKLKLFIPYNLSLRLVALNNLKQSIFNLQRSYCTIYRRKININIQDNEPFEEYESNIQFDNTSQDYNLDELVINFDPYLSYDYVQQLKFNCSSVQIPIINNSSPYNIIGYTNNYELIMNIRTFKCQRGESYNAQLGTCNLCDSSQSLYSVVIKASKCSVQDDISMKSVKSTLIELRENYWRPYDDNNMVTFCYNFPTNCNGGWSPGDESCALGHIGALCEQCDLYNIRGNGSFAVSDQFKCGSCLDLTLNTLQIFLIITWTLISILISVKENVQNVDELIIRTKAIKIGFVCTYFERVQLAVIMKILTNYLQIISSIGTFQLKLPPVLKSAFTFSGNPIKSAMYALDCFLVQLSNISILYFRNIWFLFMPIYYTTIIFIIYFMLIKIKYMEFKVTVLSTTLIFIFIYVQPDIIGSFISLLSYRKISNVFWVQGDVSYLYLTTDHGRWLLSFVVPILILFGFLIPIILYLKMFKYKGKLNDTFVLRVYGYLYNEYSKATYYWEIIKICQKELIIIFLTFYEDSIIIKGTIVFLIIFCYDILSKRYRPYKRVDLNNLDSSCSNVCGFSIVIGMAIYFADYNGNIEILWPFYVFMGIFNLYFIIRLIALLIIGYLDKLADQIDQIRDYINNKYPNLIVKYPYLQKYLESSKISSNRVKQRFLKLREYLWKKVKENKMNFNQQIEKKEQKQDSINQESRNYSNQPISEQLASEKYKNQGVIAPYKIDKKKMNYSIDAKILENRELEKFKQDNIIEKQMKRNKDSNKSIPMEIYSSKEFDFMLKDQDLQNIKDDQEQLSLSFQQ